MIVAVNLAVVLGSNLSNVMLYEGICGVISGLSGSSLAHHHHHKYRVWALRESLLSRRQYIITNMVTTLHRLEKSAYTTGKGSIPPTVLGTGDTQP